MSEVELKAKLAAERAPIAKTPSELQAALASAWYEAFGYSWDYMDDITAFMSTFTLHMVLKGKTPLVFETR